MDRAAEHTAASTEDDIPGIQVDGGGEHTHSEGAAGILRDKLSHGGLPGSPRAHRRSSVTRRRSSALLGLPWVRSGSARSDQSVLSNTNGRWGGAALHPIERDVHVQIPDDNILELLPASALKAPVLLLQNLPSELSDVLQRYDLDGNGILDREESIHAAADLARMRHQIEEGIVHLHAFPQKAQKMLERHDLDGDGTLDVGEMIIAFEALERERKARKMWMRIALAAVFFVVVLLISISGLLYFVLEISREEEIRGSVMVVKDGSEPVRTGSFELTVRDGVLLERGSEGRCAGGRECPIQVAEASEKRAVSSALPDADLSELKQLRISSADAWLQLRVTGVQRVPAPASQHGSVMVLYTNVGQAVLDGTFLHVDQPMSTVLARSGIVLPPDVRAETGGENGGLENGGLELLGLFNTGPAAT